MGDGFHEDVTVFNHGNETKLAEIRLEAGGRHWRNGDQVRGPPSARKMKAAGWPKPLAVLAQIVFALGLIPVGMRVLRRSDRDWEPDRLSVPTPATV